jgi:GAF domain-containing protein
VAQRSGTDTTKTGRRKPVVIDRPETPAASPRRRQADNDPNKIIEGLRRHLDEALEQQAATSEVLRVISRSPGDLQPVFDIIAASALRLCGSTWSAVLQFNGELIELAAVHNLDDFKGGETVRRSFPRKPSRTGVTDRAISTRTVIYIRDVLEIADYEHLDLVQAAAFRSILSTPMLSKGRVVGAITVVGADANAFTDRHIDLLKTFADQAVIAIDNARLFSELRQRTGDLAESLEQQTATSEVLKVISSSSGELEPVFRAVVENATRLCEAAYGHLLLREGPVFRAVAIYSEEGHVDLRRNPVLDVRDNPGTPIDILFNTKQVVHIPDLRTDQSYIGRNNRIVPLVEVGGARTFATVPMLKEGELIGAISLYRQEVRAFSDKQIELVQNFAAQAVIAIENTRLLNELRESLQQQTATADVLKVISRSTFDLQTVLNTLVESAARLCEAYDSVILLRQGESLGVRAHHGPIPIHFTEWPIERGWATGRAFVDRAPVHVHDLQAAAHEFPVGAEFALRLGHRTILAVPLLRENEAIGALAIRRTEVKPFTNKQIELVTTFADQAVIAIENARLFDEVQARTRELSESLEQQTATSEVLKVISSSPGELEPVFNALLANATRICEATFGTLHLCEGPVFRAVAAHSEKMYVDFLRHNPVVDLREHPGIPLDRLTKTKQVVHVPDLRTDPSYVGKDARIVPLVEDAVARTFVSVPMLKEGDLIGAINLFRQEVRPFTDKQIELVQNFAAQAVIAIENTRLLNELRESLQQQTATADVLKVISRSTFDLKTVLDTLVQSAARLCDADMASVTRPKESDDAYYHVAHFGFSPEWFELMQTNPLRPGRETLIGRTLAESRVVHIPDVLTDPEYNAPKAQQLGEFRAALGVPMLREGTTLGVFMIARRTPRPFTDKQIELATTFADQAVIAIENTRLLNELRESLQQQTATADVLKVISRSTFDLQVVLDTLVESAVRLCEAERGLVFRREGEIYKSVAYYNYSPEFRAFHESHPITPGRGTAVGRTALEGKAVQIVDVLADPEYTFGEAQKLGGGRATLGVPLLREGTPIGALALQRTEPRPYSQKQIELVETFADQAVIAIENVRLFDEVQARTRDLTDSLQQQTATADVLKIISRSAFDLPTVLDALIETAARMADAEQGSITREIDGAFFRAASYGYSSGLSDFIRNTPVQMDRSSIAGRALAEQRIVQIPDIRADPEYTFLPALDSGDFRTALGVPMLREGVLIGALALTRKEVRPFTDKQIELASTFADQAAIAIENVRLFKSVEARTRELAKSLDDLRTTQDRLVQTQKLASLGQLTAGIAHEIKNPLNFVNNFSGVSTELIDELQQALKGLPIDQKARTEIDELADTLRGNLDKVVQHGKRADAIVKNMLLHSREGSGEHRVVDINSLVDESLNLAYHGARAEKQGFDITMERSLDPAAGEVDVFPQDITRVLLNLISNGFYAATKRRAGAVGDGYEPTLVASTRSLGDRVEIKIRDNGAGIPPEVKEKMFNPFFTTKPAGEGTGLGLSICHDIIVKQHGGSIEVDTQPGEFTEIRVTLPRAAALLPERS